MCPHHICLQSLLIRAPSSVLQFVAFCLGIGADVQLIFWRFVLGFGIGGDYPLSATIMAEYSSTKWRGSFLAAVFAMQARRRSVPSLM